MNQVGQNQVSSKVIQKTISASIKKEIAARGINTTTRKGNKELKFLIGKIARYPFDNLEQAQTAGEKLGQHLAEISQQRGKENLDGGLIQQLAHQKELLAVAGLSIEASSQPSDNSSEKEDVGSVDLPPKEETQPADESNYPLPEDRPEDTMEINSESQANNDDASSSSEEHPEDTVEINSESQANDDDASSSSEEHPEDTVEINSESQANDDDVSSSSEEKPEDTMEINSESQANDDDVSSSSEEQPEDSFVN